MARSDRRRGGAQSPTDFGRTVRRFTGSLSNLPSRCHEARRRRRILMPRERASRGAIVRLRWERSRPGSPGARPVARRADAGTPLQCGLSTACTGNRRGSGLVHRPDCRGRRACARARREIVLGRPVRVRRPGLAHRRRPRAARPPGCKALNRRMAAPANVAGETVVQDRRVRQRCIGAARPPHRRVWPQSPQIPGQFRR